MHWLTSTETRRTEYLPELIRVGQGEVAYNKSLDRWGRFYFGYGLQAGYVNSFLDYTYLSFDENFEGGATTENFEFNTSGYMDINSGVEFNYLPNKFSNLNFGFNVSHINQPVQTFMSDASSTVKRKYVASLGATLPIASMAAIYPKIAYSTQGPHQEFVAGAFGKFAMDKRANMEKSIYFGALNRWNDAVIFVARMDINDISFTFSYDLNYSKLAKVSHGQGGPEIAIQYIGDIPSLKKNKVFCPHF